MNSLSTLWSHAEFAAAAYANLQRGPTNARENIDELQRVQSGAGMPSTQAVEFAKRTPNVVARYDDSQIGETSLSATLFKDTAGDDPGNITLAIRGTAESRGIPNDLSTDADILALGAGVDQIVAMANWWRKVATPLGTSVVQHSVTEIHVGELTAQDVILRAQGDSVLVLRDAPAVDATGELFDALSADPDGKVDVTGHSLGGHLAMAFSTLFPQHTGQVTVFNAPGFGDNATVRAFLGKLGGAIPNSQEIIDVIADEALVGDLPFNPIAGLYSKPGQVVNIAIENQWQSDEKAPFAALNHSITAIVDSLAVYKLLADISRQPGLDEAGYKIILNQAASGTAASLEEVVDALGRLLNIDDKPLEPGNGNRERLYQAIQRLSTRVDESLRASSEIQPAPMDAGSISAAASGGQPGAIAYRYALEALSPFLFLQNDGLYSVHNENGQLDLFDPAQRTGSLTSSWLEDRSAFLERKIYRNRFNLDKYYQDPRTADPNAFPNAPDARGAAYQSEARHYEDFDSGYIVSTGGPPDSLQHILFGGRASDVLRGAGRDDRLYGGSGSDILAGRYGTDYLEGGSGLDVYEYSVKNGLLSSGNDGNDTILDTDGKGVLRYTYTASGDGPVTKVIGGAVLAAQGGWQSADGAFTYSLQGADMVVTVTDGSGGTITLKDFRDGDFGIRLQTPRNVAQDFIREFVGDLKDRDSKPEDGIQPGPDGFGNTVRDPNAPDADRADTFFGNVAAEAEAFDTGGGDDVVYADGENSRTADVGGDDLLSTGAGRDIAEAGGGNDWIEGGADADILGGNAGDDTLYADASNDGQFTLEQAIMAGDSGQATGETGELMSGDGGMDVLLSGNASDLLFGGQDEDVIVGAAGDDTIFGDKYLVFSPLDWSIDRFQVANPGVVRYEVRSDTVSFAGADDEGAADIIYGGTGADWIFAGFGDDYVEGGADGDIVLGEGGADILLGGAGNDRLDGDSVDAVNAGIAGNDFLDGGEGEDTLIGEAGDDILYGGAGRDDLAGGEGNDLLYGGPGDDILLGGPGKDTYVFERGDGVEVISDTAGDANDPEASIVVLGEGIARGDVKFSKGSFLIDLGPSDPDDPLAGSDQIHFMNFNGDFPELTAAIGELRFADGTTMRYADVLAQGFDIDGTALDDAAGDALIGTSVTDRIRGYAGSDELEGRDGDDTLTGDAGADRLDAGNGDDVLEGGLDSDLLAGGMGSDDYVFAQGDGADTLVEGALTVRGLADAGSVDRIVFGQGIAREDVTLLRTAEGNLVVRYGENDEIAVEGQYSVAGADIERIVFANGEAIDEASLDALVVGELDGTSSDDELFGTAGDDVLRGHEGDDYLDGGARGVSAAPTGNDVLDGGAGADTYLVYWGMGSDSILETVDGSYSTLQLSKGATFDSVKTLREGDDLVVRLRGSDDGARIAGFFAGDAAQSWRIAMSAEETLPLLSLYETQASAGEDYAAEAMADYGQRVLGEWRSRGQARFELPTHAYVRSSWSQTVAVWTRYVPALPEPILDTVTFVNDPVTDSVVDRFGVARGSAIMPLSVVNGVVTRTEVDPLVQVVESDDELIASGYASPAQRVRTTYSFYAGGGGPFANERTISTHTGSVSNIITMSSAEAWAPLSLREDDAGDFRLVYDQVTEAPLLQHIVAGPGANTVVGAVMSEGDTVALIDGGAGNDYVEAGGYDFAFGGEGDDEISGGAYALGGAGFDYLHGAAFISGGADDDYLSGAEGETAFHFRADEPGWDWVEDPNGISLEDFALRAGFSGSPSNLFYGGKFRLGGEAAFQYQQALATRYGAETSSSIAGPSTVWETIDVGEDTYRYAILPLAPEGYPRGVPDTFDRERAPGWADGYYSWVFNSVEDVMRDFADLGLGFDPAAVQAIPGVPDLSEFTADNYEALRPYFEAGVIETDVVELADFHAGDRLVVGYAPPDPFAERAALRLIWGEDKVVDVELPLHDDAIGRGVEAVVLGSESVYIGDLVAEADQRGIVGTPFEDDIVLEGGGDVAVDGLSADDDISAWDSSAILRGGSGNDEIDAGGTGHDYVDGGAGDDYVYAEDAALMVGGAGDDTIESYGEGTVIAFNAGDGQDTVYAASAYTLSFGESAVASGLDLVLDGAELVLTVGEGDGVRLAGQAGGDVAVWPPITLQLVSRGGVTTHDFNAIAADFYANPGFSMTDALRAHRIAASDDQVIGGELAYRYGLPGTADSLSNAQIRAVLTDDAFGLAAQAVQPLVDPVVRGTAGHDVLTGTARADTLIGGPGNDVLDGGLGDDRYVFNAGDGMDRITDTGGADTLTFGPGIARNAIRLALGSLLIRIGDGDEVHLDDFDPAHALESGAIEWFEFDDGTRVSYAELLVAGFDLDGTAGNDVIDGTSVSDRIDGGAGDDLLRGGAGDDTYGLARGGGRDTIVDDAGTDVLLLGAGIEAGDLLVVRGEDGLSVSIRGTDDGISIPLTADAGVAVEAVRFADGTTWDADPLLDRVNDAPMLAEAPGDAVTLEDEPFQLPIAAATFADPDAWGTLTFTASLVDGAALPDWLAFDGETLTFSGLPGNGDVGEHALRVVATDQDGLSASAAFTLTVENVNDAPELVSPLVNRLVAEDQPMAFSLSLDAFADVDPGDVLTYGADAADGGALPAWLSFDAQARTFSGTPGNDDVGTQALRVTATDGAGTSASGEFSLIVENVNDAPELTAALPGRLAYQNAPFEFALAADLFTDVDAGDVLTFSASSDDGSPLPAWLTFEATDRVFRGAPDETQTGVYGIAVTATDGSGATATAAFDLTVSDAGAYDTVYRGTRRADVVTTSVGNDVIDAGKGDDVVSSMAGRDVVFGGKGEDRVALGYGNDMGFGGEGRDKLDGGPGNDLLVGGDGDDRLDGGAGNDVLVGGAGKDELRAGDGNNLLIGGPGGDALYGGAAHDVFAFNRRDGKATIVGGDAAIASNRDTLSFGAGISARDIVFRRSGKDLVVKVDEMRDEREDGDVSVTLKDWYGAGNHRSVTRLQLVGDRTDVYDFTALVARFDAATRGKSTPWRAAPAMPAAHLASSGDETIGGVLAHAYGKTGSLASVSAASLEATLADPAFARDPQSVVNGAGDTLAAYFAHDARDEDDEDDGWTWPDLPRGEHGSHERDEHHGPARHGDERHEDHGHSGLVKPVNLQAILEAMQGFAPDRDDRPAGQRPFNLSGASHAASEGVSSWALTRALWQFHVSAPDDAVLGGGDGGAHGRGAAFPGVSIPAAQAAIGVPGFGRDAQSLQHFGGLHEGLARLG